MENNMAFCARLQNIQKIEGADKIVQADVVLNGVKITQVVVGLDTKEDTPVVYFDSNLCIEESVIIDIDKGTPGYGKEGFISLGAYLGKNGRVKVVKLRGVISNGLAVEVSKLERFVKDEQLVEGFAFTSLGDREICKKYTVPIKVARSQGKQGKQAKKETVLIPDQFHFHIDTDQLLRNLHKLNPGQTVSISRKVHGTSAIFGRNLVKRPLNFVEKIARFLGAKVNNTVYADIVASRTVVKSIDAGEVKKATQGSGFYKIDVWSDAAERNFKGKLHDGETVYYEIVGYLPGSQSMIQKGYSYGCDEGEYKIAVYRITQTALDGRVYEYGWQAMKARCIELGVPMVEEYFFGTWAEFCMKHWGLDNFMSSPSETLIEEWRQTLLTKLKELYLEKDCPDCFDSKKRALPDEGVVIRIEGLGIESYKLKSEKFLLRESKEAEEGVVSVEDEEQSA